jgi:protein-tyrosine phosphatase
MRTSRTVARTAAGVALTAALLATTLTAQAVVGLPAAPAAAVRAAQAQGPSLNLPDAPNARDIGGYTTWTGARVRTGLVFRSDALNKLGPAEVATLGALGPLTVIDFRGPDEIAAAADKLPPDASYVNLPVYNPQSDLYTLLNETIEGGPAVQQQVLGDGRNVQIMTAYYRWLVTDPTARAQFGTALTNIADSTGPVLYHCSAGKDRTGWMSAILLTLLGVPASTVYQDYLASNADLSAANQAQLTELEQAGLVTDPSLLEPMLGVQADYLTAAFEQANASYGSFYGFVRAGLGISQATIARIQSRLLSNG